MIFNFYAQFIPRVHNISFYCELLFIPREFFVYMYICMCYIKQLAIKTKHFHWCWYFSTDQWICCSSYFIWVVVSANHCWPLWAHPCIMTLPWLYWLLLRVGLAKAYLKYCYHWQCTGDLSHQLGHIMTKIDCDWSLLWAPLRLWRGPDFMAN